MIRDARLSKTVSVDILFVIDEFSRISFQETFSNEDEVETPSYSSLLHSFIYHYTIFTLI